MALNYYSCSRKDGETAKPIKIVSFLNKLLLLQYSACKWFNEYEALRLIYSKNNYLLRNIAGLTPLVLYFRAALYLKSVHSNKILNLDNRADSYLNHTP